MNIFNMKKADRRMIFLGWQMLMVVISILGILLAEVPGDTEIVSLSLALGAFASLLLAIVINITSVVRRLNDLAIKRWVAFPLLAWLYFFTGLETALYSFPVVSFIISTFLIFTPSRPVNDVSNVQAAANSKNHCQFVPADLAFPTSRRFAMECASNENTKNH